MTLRLSVRQVDGVAVVDLGGRITLGEASGTLRETIKDLLAHGQKDILLNLAEVTYIDSSGLGEFVGGYATVASRGGRLKLLSLQNRIYELMQITKLYTVFETFTDEAKAIRSFQKVVVAGA